MRQFQKINKASTTSITPSATLGNYGQAFTVTSLACAQSSLPQSSQSVLLQNAYSINLQEVDFQVTTIGTETLTFQVIGFFNDGTSVTVNNMTATTAVTAIYGHPCTAPGAANATPQSLKTLCSDGKELVAVSCNVKSSIGSSTAKVTVTVLGETRPNV